MSDVLFKFATDPMMWFTAAIAVATVANVLVTRRYADITRAIHEAGSRPYLAVNALGYHLEPKGGRLKFEYKNFGSVLAVDVACKWSVQIDGKDLIAAPPLIGTVVAPQIPTQCSGLINYPLATAISRGEKTMEVIITLMYHSAAKTLYCTSTTFRFNHTHSVFSQTSGSAT